jgi:ech hydrogenase subunit A
MSTLVGLAILFPIITGLICLPIKNHRARGGIVSLTAVVLIVTSILFLRQGPFPIGYSTASAWDSVILVFNYLILAFFIFAAIRDINQRGISRHNILTQALTVATGIDTVIPVDVYVPNCTARPETIIDGVVLALKKLFRS